MRIAVEGSYPLVETRGDGPEVERVREVVRRLIESTDSADLSGISKIILTQTAALGRRELQRHSSRPGSRLLGSYHPAFHGSPAWIELFVDAILADAPMLSTRIPLFRDHVIARVLFHEVGHHHERRSPVHTKKRRERSAEQFGRALTARALKRIHPVGCLFLKWSRPMLRSLSGIRARQQTPPTP